MMYRATKRLISTSFFSTFEVANFSCTVLAAWKDYGVAPTSLLLRWTIITEKVLEVTCSEGSAEM
jgi:hypothetical protein